MHVWIVNEKGAYLIAQRAADRPTYPLMWECVGGSVIAGETSSEGAVREVREEVVIDLLPESGTLLHSTVRKKVGGAAFNDILDVWLFPFHGEIPLWQATTDEVAAARWMTRDEIRALSRSGRLVPTLAYFFDGIVPAGPADPE